MKWFKHLTTSNMDIALREIVEEFGCSGYGLWWITCELVGGQGVNFRLKKDKNWLLNLKIISKMSEEDIKKFLKKFSELGLINKKDFDSGILHIQNMDKYADEYTVKVGRKSRQCPDNVPLDKTILDKNKLDNKEKLVSFKKGERWGEKPYYVYGNKEFDLIWKDEKWLIAPQSNGGEWSEYNDKESLIKWKTYVRNDKKV